MFYAFIQKSLLIRTETSQALIIYKHTHSFILMFNWCASFGGDGSQWERANCTQKRPGQRFLNSEMFYDSADGVWYHVPPHQSNSSWNIRERPCHDVQVGVLSRSLPTVMMDADPNASMLAGSSYVCPCSPNTEGFRLQGVRAWCGNNSGSVPSKLFR